MTPDQMRKQKIERFVMLDLIILRLGNNLVIQNEMETLCADLGLLKDQILHERTFGLYMLGVRERQRAMWGTQFDPNLSNDIGAL